MSAETDWKDFAFEMANILGENKEMSDEHERKNSLRKVLPPNISDVNIQAQMPSS